jgi:hypothetical protein
MCCDGMEEMTLDFFFLKKICCVRATLRSRSAHGEARKCKAHAYGEATGAYALTHRHPHSPSPALTVTRATKRTGVHAAICLASVQTPPTSLNTEY